MTSQKQTRAVLLLHKLIATDQFDRAAIANALDVSDTLLERYAAESEPMPLDAQQRLATFVIERVPALARLGHRLRAQVAAAVDFQSGRTETHMGPPPRS